MHQMRRTGKRPEPPATGMVTGGSAAKIRSTGCSEQLRDVDRIGWFDVGGVHLGELQLAGDVVVNAVPVRVRLEHPDARFAGAVAAAFDPAERHVRLGAVGGVVDRGHAGLDVLAEGMGPLAVVGVDAAGQAVIDRVGGLDGFVDAVDLQIGRASCRESWSSSVGWEGYL